MAPPRMMPAPVSAGLPRLAGPQKLPLAGRRVLHRGQKVASLCALCRGAVSPHSPLTVYMVAPVCVMRDRGPVPSPSGSLASRRPARGLPQGSAHRSAPHGTQGMAISRSLSLSDSIFVLCAPRKGPRGAHSAHPRSSAPSRSGSGSAWSRRLPPRLRGRRHGSHRSRADPRDRTRTGNMRPK